MIEIIKNLLIVAGLIFSLVIVIVKFINKNIKKAKLDGIEKLAMEITRQEKEEKPKEQRRIAKERSDTLFMNFLDIFCKNLNLDMDSKEAKYYQALILDKVRVLTDNKLDEVIETNKIAVRVGQKWIDYRKMKREAILNEVIKYISLIYRDDLIGVPHSVAIIKCRDEIVKAYDSCIIPLLDEIKEVADVYACKIAELERVLHSLKNGKKKGV